VEYVTYSTLEFIQKYKAVRTFPKTDNEVFFGRMGLSGLFALSVAIKEGYDRCFVLGFDFGSVTNSNTTHWYQDKIKELNIKSNGAGNPGIYLNKGKLKEEVWDFSYYDTWKNKIYNVSPLSKIPNLNKINYQQFYELIKDSDGINAAS